jgi:hypothetical protein
LLSRSNWRWAALVKVLTILLVGGLIGALIAQGLDDLLS